MQNRIINEEGSIHSLYINLINKYLYFLFCVFLIFSLFIGLFLKDIPISLFFIFISFSFLLIGKIKKSDCSKKVLNTLVSSIIIALTFHISFFHVYNYKDVGDEYFYFSLLFAIPFFFDYKTQRNIVYVLVLFILLNFVVVESFDLNFIPRNRFLKDTDYKVLKLVNVMMSVTTFFFHIGFIVDKDHKIDLLIKDINSKKIRIEDLAAANKELNKKTTIIQDLVQNKVKEISELAEQKSPLFLEKFQLFFPDFIPALLKINPDLVPSELQMCALIKLEFRTKDIAICTDSTVKSVESRKYRVKKKLHIPGDVNIDFFLSQL
ncbi:helix-turn-helix transcriptional regulator [Elizabethkingia anophelis]|uniref:helix-turn-helix transcriptional regulator n=1 Tax=Elizabethkingia anophelis TaxID=1117645 RepID=UPI0011EB4976|nr:Two component regulator three Y domain-containing protein [Elizabethkingia anophelis]MCT3772620.1 Two component regulator three Y domain-containing protein [Elizabethkingia anophelis]MCT4183657.1 Two component regulator three Y domain-containing protein [Elizabethkingia anophelis]MCT4273080.1 Two component regulator three Y domain-containing protein [Elizabethkingia anophelis]MCT4290941.1 Two component regulator three Y domain-containing protein [Elizabethkingia anophelis]TYT30401.1 Two com